MAVRVIHSECVAAMREMEAESFSACVCDPPAGISFMQKSWDHDKGGRDQWIAWMQTVASEVMRVCKPGAHALVWALPRTSHWTATAWENAGWTVRERISHLFASGFPKSLDVSKAIDRAAGAEREVLGKIVSPFRVDAAEQQRVAYGDFVAGINEDGYRTSTPTAPTTEAACRWEGWGTALKPACEDWWLFRKPLSEPTVAANALKHSTGALNIDASRVAAVDGVPKYRRGDSANGYFDNFNGNKRAGETDYETGRWPANVIHSGDQEVLDAFARFGERTSRPGNSTSQTRNSYYGMSNKQKQPPPCNYVDSDDTGTAARFFKSCPWSEDELRFHFSGKATADDRCGARHPTVKPVALMEWLVRLITPPGGRVLDPFCGTGSTLVACDHLGFDAIGIEQDAQSVADAEHKIRVFRARRALGKVDKQDLPAVGQLGLDL